LISIANSHAIFAEGAIKKELLIGSSFQFFECAIDGRFVIGAIVSSVNHLLHCYKHNNYTKNDTKMPKHISWGRKLL